MAPRPGRRASSAPPTLTFPRAVRHDEDESWQLLESAYSVRWQCYVDEYGVWYDYSGAENVKIEAAWHAEKISVGTCTPLGDERWRIDFVALRQVNNTTGRRRPVRRILITHS